MPSFNVHDAKTQFSKLLAKVESGEEVVIARNGKPVAKLVRIRSKKRAKFGFGRHIWEKAGLKAPTLEPMDDHWLDNFYNGPIVSGIPLEDTVRLPKSRKKRKAG